MIKMQKSDIVKKRIIQKNRIIFNIVSQCMCQFFHSIHSLNCQNIANGPFTNGKIKLTKDA